MHFYLLYTSVEYFNHSTDADEAVGEGEACGLLSPVHTVAEKRDCRRCLAVFCDSLTFLRQYGQGLRLTEL